MAGRHPWGALSDEAISETLGVVGVDWAASAMPTQLSSGLDEDSTTSGAPETAETT